MPPSTHILPVRPLTAAAFAPYGQVILARRTGGQGVGPEEKHPAADPAEAQLVLTNGTPRLWVMHLPHVGLSFTRIARHRRVTQCLGALGGKEWLIAVAPPDPAEDARPRLEDIVAFRIPGDRIVKLHAATWHAGPHFLHDECLFLNLENMDTNDRDFHAAELGVTCAYEL